MAAVLAFVHAGPGQGVTFTLIGVALAAGTVGVLRAVRWVLLVSTVLLGAQLGPVVATAWELGAGVDTTKSHELRQLGFDPTLGVAINLGYSLMASVLLGWLAVRWWHTRKHRSAASTGSSLPDAQLEVREVSGHESSPRAAGQDGA